MSDAAASMPGEEEIARALSVADGNHPEACSNDADSQPLWELYRGQARAVLAFFASILAEKERLVSYWLYQHDQGQEEIRQLSDNLAFAEHEAKALEARALAAEAALAGERERCAKVIERYQEVVNLKTAERMLEERSAGNLVALAYAAAIRAGE